MSGEMWVKSEVGNGSQFYFTTKSKLSKSSLDRVLDRLLTFKDRMVLFVDTHNDRTGLQDRVLELGLKPYVVHDINEVKEKEGCPQFDTVIVDSIEVVSVTKSFVFDFTLTASQTEILRQFEHLRYIPLVMLAAVSALLLHSGARLISLIFYPGHA
jgi:osomolarity two-component system, sensor histidine kinase NIK1